jgi:selenocysteine lyase/cysteine desulfurase
MSNTRRSFLGGLTGVAAGLSIPLSAASPGKGFLPLMAVESGSESYWKLVTQQFALRPGKIMMNAANLCPALRSVTDRVAELTRDIDSDVSSNNRAKFRELLEESRAKVAGQLGVSVEEVALVRNTSEANNVINNGSPLKAGDEVVIWDQNHECNNIAWDVRAARFGFTVKRVNVPSTTSAAEMVKLFEAALTPRTRVLSITYISNTTGIRLPAKEIFAMAKQRGDIYCHLDGAQTWGFLHLNLKDIGCDSFGASAHKWLMGPKQVGVLYVRQERIPQIWANIVTVGWGTKVDTTAKGARKFEVLGQRDDAGLASIATAVDFHRTVGFDNIEARTMELAGALQAGLLKINRLKTVTPVDPKLRGGVIITVIPDGVDRRAFLGDLYNKYGVAGAGTGGLRLAPHTYNTMEDVDQTIDAVRKLLA